MTSYVRTGGLDLPTSSAFNKKIAVLMGGRSREREISLVTGRECAIALRQAGFHKISEVDIAENLVGMLTTLKPDICFNALHGPLGEDGSIQGLLNVIGISYTHSGVLASSIAMHKEHTKRFAQSIGIRCPQGSCLDQNSFFSQAFSGPYVIKPINDGSSINIFVVRDPLVRPFEVEAWPYDEAALVEEFIQGIELTVTVLDGEPLTVTEIIPETEFYDYHAKYALGGSRHVLPARIPEEIFSQCLAWAKAIHAELECRGISRSDFIYDQARGREGLFFLEINTQPGMTPTSLAPEQARFCGISFPELVTRLVDCATTDAA
jgi:D-alanine-D-alanine ligase